MLTIYYFFQKKYYIYLTQLFQAVAILLHLLWHLMLQLFDHQNQVHLYLINILFLYNHTLYHYF